jgi:hypothetical protein
MKSSLSREEAESMLQAEKIVSVPVHWEPVGNGRWKLEAPVFLPDLEETLTLRGNVGRTNYSFSLLYNNCPIRKYTRHAPHKIGGQIFKEPHKHVWNGQTENQEAYIPDDINPNDDINVQFKAFCKECTITILSDYQQTEFF